MNARLSLLDPEAKRKALVSRTLKWWDGNRRRLAWRAPAGEKPDPYRVWLSEILLQQTTARAATPYYEIFLTRWPKVQDLAAASEEAIMSAFAGLGYYARARNLHECAKTIAAAGGRFPADEADLRALPGVGRYTAAAIAAIAFDRQTLPVDGNVSRILARLVALERPLAGSRAEIESLARSLAPPARAGDFAQALMDLGATVCRPRDPDCAACPLSRDCAAFHGGDPASYPRPGAVKQRPLRTGAVYFARRNDGAFLVRRRPAKGLLGSTVELPGTPWLTEAPSDWEEVAPVIARWRKLPGSVRQEFTHFSLSLTVFAGTFDGAAPVCHSWAHPHEVADLGCSAVMRKAIDHALHFQ